MIPPPNATRMEMFEEVIAPKITATGYGARPRVPSSGSQSARPEGSDPRVFVSQRGVGRSSIRFVPRSGELHAVAQRRKPTSTSNFGVGKRESHDASDFYARFAPRSPTPTNVARTSSSAGSSSRAPQAWHDGDLAARYRVWT